jgi:hypothetical protein
MAANYKLAKETEVNIAAAFLQKNQPQNYQ